MKNKKTILVTGGAGFIGSTLVDRLIEDDFNVVVVDDLSSGKEDYLNPQATFYKTNISSDDIAGIFEKEKPDYVFHLAAQIDVAKSVQNPYEDNEINIVGGLNILENCLRNKVEKIIFSSSAAIYGNNEDVPISEDAPHNPISPYGINKLTFEKYLNYYYEVFGQKYNALRFANAYGPRQFKGGECGVIGVFVENAISDKESLVYGDGEQTRDYIFVNDIVDALVASMKNEYVGIMNVSTGEEISLSQVMDLIEKKTNKEFKRKYLEPRKGDIRRNCLSPKKAKEKIGWSYKTNTEEGLSKTIDWMSEIKK